MQHHKEFKFPDNVFTRFLNTMKTNIVRLSQKYKCGQIQCSVYQMYYMRKFAFLDINLNKVLN